MQIGILAGLSAGALWGLTFVAPQAIAPYSELDLAVLRYGIFGLTSLALMTVNPAFRPGPMNTERWLQALWLGLSGFVIYYICVAYSVSLAGPAIAPLVIGALPLLLAIYGNWQDRNLAWSAIALPLALIGIGLLIVNSATLMAAASTTKQQNIIWGLLAAILGLVVWFCYAILNAKVMRSSDAPGALGWTSLQGLGALLGTIPVAIVSLAMGWSKIPTLGFAGTDGSRLLIWAVLTGVLASWLAQYLWTIASQRLPLALSAQLIVAETLFALIYGFWFEQRWPSAAEWIGATVLILGVLWGVKMFASQKAVEDH